MKSNLKILILAGWYKEAGGIPNFIEEQARMLQRNGHKVSVLHAYIKGTFIDTLKSRKTEFSVVSDEGILTSRIGVSPVLPKMRQLTYRKLIEECVHYFRSYIDEHGKPDIIHSHSMFMGGVVGFHLAKKFNIPFFHTEHTSGLVFQPSQYTLADVRLLKRVYQKSDKVFFVSDFFKRKVINQYKLKEKNIEVLHNVVEQSFFQTSNIAASVNFKYLIIGGLIPVKNHELLLKAWSILLKEYPKSKLIIAGEGPLEIELKKNASQLNIDYSLKWLSRLSREKVLDEIGVANVVLSTSKVETFGLTIAEAHAKGKPTVVTDSGGVGDSVNSINGIITEQDVASFAEGLIKIQKGYKNYNPQLISDDCYQKFSEEIIYNKLMEYYDVVLAEFLSEKK